MRSPGMRPALTPAPPDVTLEMTGSRYGLRASTVATRAGGIDRLGALAALQVPGHPFVLEPGHLHIAAERNPRDPVLRLAAAPRQDRSAEAEREAQHLDSDRLRRGEMAGLVHEDQDADDDDEGDRRQEHAASRASRRAAASAASTASSESAPVGAVVSSPRAIVWAIRPQGIAPSRNSATAISLAALKTVGAVPAAVAAARPRRYAG